MDEFKELNCELINLAKQLPSTDVGIESLSLIRNAVANVTNIQFKKQTIAYIKQKFNLK